MGIDADHSENGILGAESTTSSNRAWILHMMGFRAAFQLTEVGSKNEEDFKQFARIDSGFLAWDFWLKDRDDRESPLNGSSSCRMHIVAGTDICRSRRIH